MKSKKDKQPTSKTQKTPNTKKTKPAPIYINPKTDFGFKRLFMEGLRAKVRLLDLLKTFFPEILGDATRRAGVLRRKEHLLYLPARQQGT